MSRTMIFLCALTILSGCHTFETPRQISLVTARVETLGPRFGGGCRDCDDCIPHKPWTPGYFADCDYLNTQHTAQRCAFRGLGEYRRQCGRPVSHHFKMGFISAYEDLALNRRPSPPVMPPPVYWNAFYRSCAGKPCVDDWFAGYDAGLEMGSNSGVSRYREITLRRGCQFGSNDRYDSWQSDQGDFAGQVQSDYAAPQSPFAGEQPSQQPLYPTPEPPVPPMNAYGYPRR